MTEELVERVARKLCEIDPDGSPNWDDYEYDARAIIPIVLEEAAGVCDQAEKEADEKLEAATDEDKRRNYASAAVTSRYLARAIRSLSSPILTEEG